MSGGMINGMWEYFDCAYFCNGQVIAYDDELARAWWSLNKDKTVYRSLGDGSDDVEISRDWRDEEEDE